MYLNNILGVINIIIKFGVIMIKKYYGFFVFIITAVLFVGCDNSTEPENFGKIKLELKNIPENSIIYYAVFDGDVPFEAIQNGGNNYLVMGYNQVGENQNTVVIKKENQDGGFEFDNGKKYQVAYLVDVPTCNYDFINQTGHDDGDGGGLISVDVEGETIVQIDYENMQWKR